MNAKPRRSTRLFWNGCSLAQIGGRDQNRRNSKNANVVALTVLYTLLPVQTTRTNDSLLPMASILCYLIRTTSTTDRETKEARSYFLVLLAKKTDAILKLLYDCLFCVLFMLEPFTIWVTPGQSGVTGSPSQPSILLLRYIS